MAYGANMTTADVQRVEKLYKERFDLSTDGKIHLEVIDRIAVDLAPGTRDLTELRNKIKGTDSQRANDRLTRLWYYYNSDLHKITAEIQSELLKAGMKSALDAADAVLVLSGPQFEGIGIATGGYALTEQPSEIAWGLADGGATEINTDERLVDELLHEGGHLLGLDHTSQHCMDDKLSLKEREECCKTSPGAKDVMSYCRNRASVAGPNYFGYTACTKDYLEKVTLPALLNGGLRPFQEKACD